MYVCVSLEVSLDLCFLSVCLVSLKQRSQMEVCCQESLLRQSTGTPCHQSQYFDPIYF